MLPSVYLSGRLSLPVTLVTFLLFFTPLLLLNYFLFNFFLFLQKGGRGAKAPPAPPSARSLYIFVDGQSWTYLCREGKGRSVPTFLPSIRLLL